MSTREHRVDRRRGLVASHLLALSIGVVAVGTAAVFSVSGLTETERSEPTEQELQSAAVVLLGRLGITPEALAAAGVTTAEASALISTASSAIADGDPLESADTTLASARTARDVARQQLLRGTLSEDEIPGCVNAIDHCAALEQQHDAARDALFESVTADLRADQRSALQLVVSQSAGLRGAMAPYLVVERSSAEVVALRDALDAERIALDRERPIDPEVAGLLETVRDDAAVAAARDASSTLLGSLNELWRSAQVVPPA